VNPMPAAAGLPDSALLFSETPSRFLVEVPDIVRAPFEALLKGSIGRLGKVTRTQNFVIKNKRSDKTLVRQPIERLHEAWETVS